MRRETVVNLPSSKTLSPLPSPPNQRLPSRSSSIESTLESRNPSGTPKHSAAPERRRHSPKRAVPSQIDPWRSSAIARISAEPRAPAYARNWPGVPTQSPPAVPSQSRDEESSKMAWMPGGAPGTGSRPSRETRNSPAAVPAYSAPERAMRSAATGPAGICGERQEVRRFSTTPIRPLSPPNQVRPAGSTARARTAPPHPSVVAMVPAS